MMDGTECPILKGLCGAAGKGGVNMDALGCFDALHTLASLSAAS